VEFLKKFTTTCSRNIALFYRTVDPDSIRKNIKIVDSTTISLFKDILKCVEEKLLTEKAKAESSHSVINADEKYRT
jgi:hypothetical protein